MLGKMFKGLVEGVAAPVANVMEKKEETKQVKAKLQSKLDLSDQELNLLRTEKTDKTWRDEYVTVWATLGVTVLSYFVFQEGGVDAVIRLLQVPLVQWSVIAVVIGALGVKGFNQLRGK